VQDNPPFKFKYFIQHNNKTTINKEKKKVKQTEDIWYQIAESTEHCHLTEHMLLEALRKQHNELLHKLCSVII